MNIHLFNDQNAETDNVSGPTNKQTQYFDAFKAINTGKLSESDIVEISKLPWFNMWARKELRKSFAKKQLTRDQIKTFNSTMKSNYSSDNAVNRFTSPSELDQFLNMIGNISVSEVLKTKVILSVLYPKVKLTE